VLVHRVLFLDDDSTRHAAFAARAKKLFRGQRHQVLRTNDPHVAADLIERLGPRLSAVFLDRDLGLPTSGEYVAERMALLPKERRPRKVVVHSRNFIRAPKMVKVLRAAGYHVIRAPFR
jgi:hypothetical protein